MTVYSPFSALPRDNRVGDRICTCGIREGLHRWGDQACPNLRWSTGNGQAQWLVRVFHLAGRITL